MIVNLLTILPLLVLGLAFQEQHVFQDRRPSTLDADFSAVLQDGPPCPFDADFSALVKETLDTWHVPGLSIAVVDGPRTWAKGYGISKFPSTPVTPETLFYGASTTKAFTAAAMSLLISSGNYSSLENGWKTPVASLIYDDFVMPEEYLTSRITIEDTLSHRTGMPRHDFSYGGKDEEGKKRNIKDITRSLRDLPVTAGLRERFQYCNIMFCVASHVIETLTGTWLGDFMKEKIWEPLGMQSTYFDTEVAKAAPEPLAQGYVWNQDKYQEVPYMDLHVVSGAGSIISNVLDYSKWIRAFLGTSGPLSKSDWAAVKAPRTLIEGGEMDRTAESPYTGPQAYSLGWMTGIYRGYEYFQHSGGMEAFGAEVVIFPALDYGLVSFGNTATTSNAAEMKLIFHLVDEKIGLPSEERFDWNKQHKEGLKKQEEKYEKAVQRYYPNTPSPPLPHSLPVQNYTGTYAHPAYHNVTLSIKDSKLHYDGDNRSWRVVFDLEHVSGEYFIAYIDSSTAPGMIFKEAVAAEFDVGADGVAGRLGMAVEEEMGTSGRIWFERIE